MQDLFDSPSIVSLYKCGYLTMREIYYTKKLKKGDDISVLVVNFGIVAKYIFLLLLFTRLESG